MTSTTLSTTTVCTLDEVLQYQNENVTYRFMKAFAVSEEEAEDIFTETKKWLWLCSQSLQDGVRLVVTDDIGVIDEMWHNFILFTKDYDYFCQHYFGEYIHHVPESKANQEATAEKNEEENNAAMRNILEQMFGYIYDKLGEETLVKWYEEYADKYTPENLLKLRTK
ncbi:MAG: glycine-rich domain-containing protein [Thermoflexibacteraceae bacterium]